MNLKVWIAPRTFNILSGVPHYNRNIKPRLLFLQCAFVVFENNLRGLGTKTDVNTKELCILKSRADTQSAKLDRQEDTISEMKRKISLRGEAISGRYIRIFDFRPVVNDCSSKHIFSISSLQEIVVKTV